MITVYNKIDLSPYTLCSKRHNLISAHTGDGIKEFKTKINELLINFLIINLYFYFLRETSLNYKLFLSTKNFKYVYLIFL